MRQFAQSTYDDKGSSHSLQRFQDAISSIIGRFLLKVGVEGSIETIDDRKPYADKLIEAGYVPFTLANGSKWTGSMYYMYLVARVIQEMKEFGGGLYLGRGSFTSDGFLLRLGIRFRIG